MPSYRIYDKNRKPIGFLKGKLGPHCGECGDVGTYLCDHPVGARGRTCDRPLCEYHANTIGHDRHLCAEHYVEYQTLGGMQLELDVELDPTEGSKHE